MATTVFDKPVGTEIGQLSSLTTSNKTNLVNAINSLNSKTIPEKLNITLASQYYSFERKWAYKIGRLVILNIVFKSTTQIANDGYFFYLTDSSGNNIIPAPNNDGSSEAVPVMYIANANSVYGIFVTFGGRKYFQSRSTIPANTEISVIGTFICN